MSQYTLYIDSPQAIQCKAEITGAEKEEVKARLMIETQNRCLYFNGKVDENGNVSVPMNSMKDIIKEATNGSIMLEVIVGDTLFVPWKTDFVAKFKKKVALSEVHQNSLAINAKPKVSVIMENDNKGKVKTIKEHTTSIIKKLRSSGIVLENVSRNKNKIGQIVGQYANKNSIGAEDLQKIKHLLANNIEKL